MQNTDSHQHPQHRPIDLDSEQENIRAGESSTDSHLRRLHSLAGTHLCMTWHLWSDGKAQVHLLASIHPYSSIHSSHECSHTVLHACTGWKPHTHLCLETHTRRESKPEKGEKSWTLWQPFLPCGGRFNFLFFIGVKPVNSVVTVSGEWRRDLPIHYTCIHSPPNSPPIQAAT